MTTTDLRQLNEDLQFVFGATHVRHYNPDLDDEAWRASYDTCTDSVCTKIRDSLTIAKKLEAAL